MKERHSDLMRLILNINLFYFINIVLIYHLCYYNTMKYELVKFVNNNLELEVNVSPDEETVWLSLTDLCVLFDRDKSVISRHIKNIFKDGELSEEQVVAKNATTGPDGKTYNVSFYNLDVIISIGYRVKSQNGVAFRKWAMNVLKEFLIKGYVINSERTLVTNENYANLIYKVDLIDKRVTKIEKDNKYRIIDDKLIYDGDIFDTLVLINEIVSCSSSSIVLFDPYADIKTLNAFKNKKVNVSLLLITSNKQKLSQIDIDAFNEEYNGLTVKIDDRHHDRYLIIDDYLFYHLGSSVNYLGKNLSQITKIEDEDIKNLLRKRINEQQ